MLAAYTQDLNDFDDESTTDQIFTQEDKMKLEESANELL